MGMKKDSVFGLVNFNEWDRDQNGVYRELEWIETRETIESVKFLADSGTAKVYEIEITDKENVGFRRKLQVQDDHDGGKLRVKSGDELGFLYCPEKRDGSGHIMSGTTARALVGRGGGFVPIRIAQPSEEWPRHRVADLSFDL